MQMVACDRGVAALPKWLAEEYSETLPLAVLPLGENGIFKKSILELAKQMLVSSTSRLCGFSSWIQ